MAGPGRGAPAVWRPDMPAMAGGGGRGAATAQLWRLQVVDGQQYTNRASANWLRQAVIPPQRGVIYDRNKTLLAANAPIFVISITPGDVPKGRMAEIIIRVATQ